MMATDEEYESACESTNLRVGGAIRTPGDMTAAAGMNRHRTGLALLRLHSEWSSAAKPSQPTRERVKAIAKELGVDSAQAWDEARRWYANELSILALSLRSIASVRSSILARSIMSDWGCDEHVIAAVLLWWLDPRCTSCGGRQEAVSLRGGKRVGSICADCKGSGLERQGDPPHGQRGVKVAQHIRDCLADARRELREGAYLERRTEAGKQHRGE